MDPDRALFVIVERSWRSAPDINCAVDVFSAIAFDMLCADRTRLIDRRRA
jgi:hypothetical protein